MYARRFEERPVAHDGSTFRIHAQRYTLVREMSPVHKEQKIACIVMLKSLRVSAQRTDKIGVLNHSEQETLGGGI